MKGNVKILAIILVLILLASGGVVAMKYVNDTKIVGPKYPENSDGAVTTPPFMILQAVNDALSSKSLPPIDLNVLALARAINSEHGREPYEVRRWIAWAIRNDAEKSKRSVFDKLTKSNNSKTSGFFARQRTDARYAATNLDARMTDIELAQSVMNASVSSDPTDGATNFFSPGTQDALFAKAQAGDPRYVGRITRDAAATRALWLSRGLKSRGTPPGVNPDVVEFFGA